MRKVTLVVKAEIIVEMDDGVEVDKVVSEINNAYNFDLDGAVVIDVDIKNYEVIDSK